MGQNIDHHLPFVLMRVGATATLKDIWKNKTISFGCAANWLDYALTHDNQSIGDYDECIFARARKNDSTIDEIKDSHGMPIGNHLLAMENLADSSVTLRFIPTILKPILCFYSLSLETILKECRSSKICTFNLDQYCSYMNYSIDDVSYLIIVDVNRFIEELKRAVITAVENNKDNLTSQRFYNDFNPETPISFGNICYNKHQRGEYFYDIPNGSDELLWKFPEYSYQSEFRISIPHLDFSQGYDPNREYDYTRNNLSVFLPHLQSYTKILPAKSIHTLCFNIIDLESGCVEIYASKHKQCDFDV